MVTYTHNHKSPIEAKIMLLLGMCGARASEFSYDDWGDNRTLQWKEGRRINKKVRDYVRMVFVAEHDQPLKFSEFKYENALGGRIYKYIIAPLKN